MCINLRQVLTFATGARNPGGSGKFVDLKLGGGLDVKSIIHCGQSYCTFDFATMLKVMS